MNGCDDDGGHDDENDDDDDEQLLIDNESHGQSNCESKLVIHYTTHTEFRQCAAAAVVN